MNTPPSIDEVFYEINFYYEQRTRLIIAITAIAIAFFILFFIVGMSVIDVNDDVIYDCERGEIIYFWSDKVEVVRVSPHNCQMIKERND